MISLFIDTSLENVSISTIKDGHILAVIQKCIPNMHSVYATSFVKQVLDDSKIDANMVDKIMVVTGPGSFTGLRIGVTIAKTYGYLIKKEITPISSLKMLAISSEHKGVIMSIIPANKSSYYVGIYDSEYNLLIDEMNVKDVDVIKLIEKYNPYIVGVNTSIIGKYKINKQELDIEKIVKYYMDKETVNYFKLVPDYKKLPQALENIK